MAVPVRKRFFGFGLGGVEPSRCAHGADNNKTIGFDPKQNASATDKD